MNRLALPLAAVAGTLAAIVAGPDAFGRLALLVGLPELAVPLFQDPAWKGVALYRSGRFEKADQAFRDAGSRATFNRGNSLAKLGRYAEAVAYYDAVLFGNPEDEGARANRDLVASLVDPVIGEAREGRSILPQALVPEGAAGASTSASGSEIKPVDYERSKKPVDAMSIAAGREWLTTLSDEPGRYLKLRIADEHRRRIERGIAAPPADTPW